MGLSMSRMCDKKKEKTSEINVSSNGKGQKGQKGPNPKSSKPPVKQEKNSPIQSEIVKAFYDFSGTHDGDLVFKKGELMKIISKEDPDWWEAEKLKDGSRGFIPKNYIVVDSTKVEAQEWWFDVDRRTGNQLLKLSENDLGAFMIRKTEDNTSLFALSVLCSRNDDKRNVKHFKVNEDDDGKLFITKGKQFDNILGLVEYYRYNNLPKNQLQLKHPCTREVQNIPFKDLELDRRNLEIHEKLGDGMFGTVMKATLNNKITVAVKMLKENSLMELPKFVEEAQYIHKLRHPRVVQLIGICMEAEPHYIITEYMSNGSLLNFLRSNSSSLEAGQLIDLAFQIADGMSYLESQDPPVIHRDLRAANCLVNENNIAKVADFGLAKSLAEDDIYEGGVDCKFPVKWTAPEGLSKKIFTVKSDAWSYGVLLYEIFGFGKSPYLGWNNAKIKEEVLRGYRLPAPSKSRIPFPEEMQTLMSSCMSWIATQRPTFEGIKGILSGIGGGVDGYQTVDEN